MDRKARDVMNELRSLKKKAQALAQQQKNCGRELIPFSSTSKGGSMRKNRDRRTKLGDLPCRLLTNAQ
jgi:hypothetical protein